MEDKNTLEDGECSDSDGDSVRYLCSMPCKQSIKEEDGESRKDRDMDLKNTVAYSIPKNREDGEYPNNQLHPLHPVLPYEQRKPKKDGNIIPELSLRADLIPISPPKQTAKRSNSNVSLKTAVEEKAKQYKDRGQDSKRTTICSNADLSPKNKLKIAEEEIKHVKDRDLGSKQTEGRSNSNISLKTDLEALEKKIKHYKDRDRSSKRTTVCSSSDLSLKHKLKMAEEETKLFKEVIDKLSTELGESKSELRSNRKSLSEYHKELNKIEDSKRELKANLKNVENKAKKLKRGNSLLEKSNSDFQTKLKNCESELEAYRKERVDLADDNRDLQLRLEMAEEKAGLLTTQITNVESATLVEPLSYHSARKMDVVTLLKEEVEELKKRIRELQAGTNPCMEPSNKSSSSKVEIQLNKCMSELLACREWNKDLLRINNDLTAKLQISQRKVEQLRVSLKDTEYMSKAKDTALAMLNAEVETIKAYLENSRKQRNFESEHHVMHKRLKLQGGHIHAVDTEPKLAKEKETQLQESPIASTNAVTKSNTNVIANLPKIYQVEESDITSQMDRLTPDSTNNLDSV
ncbi:hypothetical protein DdX_18265 [Ditylenchus destructor]|uniref:Uncharacterized protein n=1 Tax=Ditylenchus destructor TaxID=166010 RepID=A0AAD4MK26_9BILA|nr:hypothetical protein DdX_18265 [Ditylenchus destructor]